MRRGLYTMGATPQVPRIMHEFGRTIRAAGVADSCSPGINNCVKLYSIALVQATSGEYIGAKIGVVG